MINVRKCLIFINYVEDQIWLTYMQHANVSWLIWLVSYNIMQLLLALHQYLYPQISERSIFEVTLLLKSADF